ncbi:MAG: DNA recombination protein RmuC [Legionellaceae bacterium]|nr:DNA recombination protein RmuC [Legionellaceae bacterium]
MDNTLLACLAIFSTSLLVFAFFCKRIILKAMDATEQKLLSQHHQQRIELIEHLQNKQQELQEKFHQHHLTTQNLVQESIQQNMQDIRSQLTLSFSQHAARLGEQLEQMTQNMRDQQMSLSQQIHQQLNQGFEHTTTTFTDVLKRLVIIDEAQKKITELSTHVVSLQDVLQDKRSRGAFGEVQLQSLIQNMIPSQHYKMQHTLSNQKRVDCMLFLPEPTGDIAIDAKFPLENYQNAINNENAQEKKQYQSLFRQDVIKHIKDIAGKYIIPGETADAALLFIPAEAIFAEIHAHYPDIILLSQRLHVFLVSPSTLMAVLTTARAVLKDDATKKQVHIIQQHLMTLAQDFQRFDKRMEKLSKHLDLAHGDLQEVHTSAKKISSRFQKIEAVEWEEPVLLEPQL